jgi:hypothetical protein
VVHQAKWKRIGVLYSEDAYGQDYMFALRAQIKSQIGDDIIDFVSAVFKPGVRSSMATALQHIREKKVKVIIYAGIDDFVFSEAEAANMIYPASADYTWIGFDTWIPPASHARNVHGSLRVMASGCPGGLAKSSLMQALQQVESFSSLNGSHVKSHETALSMAELDRADLNCMAGFSYDAVWLSAIAFARLSATDAAPRENSCVMTTAEQQQGDSFFDTIKSTRFTGATGDVALLSNGDRDNKTIAVSLENLMDDGSIKQVGDLQQTNSMKDGASFSEIVWAGTSPSPSPAYTHIYTSPSPSPAYTHIYTCWYSSTALSSYRVGHREYCILLLDCTLSTAALPST